MEGEIIQYPQGTEIFKAQFLLQQIIERLQGESKKPWSSDPNICNMETIRNNINEKIKQTIIKYKIAEDPSVRLSPGWNVMYYDDRHNIIIKELNKDSGKVSDISDNNASKMVGKKNDDEYRIASPVLLNLCDKFLIMYEQSKTEQMKIIYDYLKQKFEKLISRYPD